MKIKLTRTELTEILSVHFKVSVTELEIEGLVEDRSFLGCLRRTVEQFRYTSDQKIAAIKALKTFADENPLLFTHNYHPNSPSPCRLGLADAKWAVEHWCEFLNFVSLHNRIPAPGYYEGLR